MRARYLYCHWLYIIFMYSYWLFPEVNCTGSVAGRKANIKASLQT